MRTERLLYPASVIDVTNVRPVQMDSPTFFWFDDDGAGLIKISGVNPRSNLGSAYLFFTLDDGIPPILDLADITATVVKATDDDGVEISGEWEVYAEPFAIR